MRRTLLAFAALAAVAPAVRAQNPATTRISATTSGLSAGASGVAISPDGRYVAFASYSDQIVAGDTNGSYDVFVRDRVSGVADIASLSSTGAQAHPSFTDAYPLGIAVACSRDARFVAFTTDAPDLVPGDTNGRFDVFVRDRLLGTTVVASAGPGGVPGDGDAALVSSSGFGARCLTLSISLTPDGRTIAFSSGATNLVAGDTNGRMDVFVHDLQTGITEVASVSGAGAIGNGTSVAPALSADGRYVCFQSDASNLLAGPDTNACTDVFVRDRLLATTTRVSRATDGTQSNGQSGLFLTVLPPSICHGCLPVVTQLGSSISADGRFVAFTSLATNLDPGVTASAAYVYLHDRLAGTTRNLTPLADLGVRDPSLSVDGRFVAVLSNSANLGPTDANPNTDVFRIDRALGTVTLESVDATGAGVSGAATAVVLAADGRQLAFLSYADLAGGGSQQLLFTDAWARNAPVVSFAEDCAGVASACPCANPGADGHGCASSVDAGGARLVATGTPSVLDDTLVLDVTGVPASTVVEFAQSATSAPSPSAAAFGDGTLCLTGPLLRLATRRAEHGAAHLGWSGDPRLSQLGAIPPGGASVRYQVLYRDVAAFCTSATFNASNSIGVGWTP